MADDAPTHVLERLVPPSDRRMLHRIERVLIVAKLLELRLEGGGRLGPREGRRRAADADDRLALVVDAHLAQRRRFVRRRRERAARARAAL